MLWRIITDLNHCWDLQWWITCSKKGLPWKLHRHLTHCSLPFKLRIQIPANALHPERGRASPVWAEGTASAWLYLGGVTWAPCTWAQRDPSLEWGTKIQPESLVPFYEHFTHEGWQNFNLSTWPSFARDVPLFIEGTSRHTGQLRTERSHLFQFSSASMLMSFPFLFFQSYSADICLIFLLKCLCMQYKVLIM